MLKLKFYHLHMGHPGATDYTLAGIHAAFAEALNLRYVRGHARGDRGPPWMVGVTVCRLVDDAGAELARGYAFCSAKDQFCRKTGRMIAEGRARMRLDRRMRKGADNCHSVTRRIATEFHAACSEHDAKFHAAESFPMGDPGSPLHEDGSPQT